MRPGSERGVESKIDQPEPLELLEESSSSWLRELPQELPVPELPELLHDEPELDELDELEP